MNAKARKQLLKVGQASVETSDPLMSALLRQSFAIGCATVHAESTGADARETLVALVEELRESPSPTSTPRLGNAAPRRAK